MNYGLAYGLSAFGLGQQLRIDPARRAGLMDEYFETFGGVRDYLGGVVDEARRTGFTETILGRRRYLPDLTSDNRQRREMAERMALNAPIQGSAADLIKVAMLNVDRGARASRAALADAAPGPRRARLRGRRRASGTRSRRWSASRWARAADAGRPARRVGRHRPQLARGRALTERQRVDVGVLAAAPTGRRDDAEADGEQRDEQDASTASTTVSRPAQRVGGRADGRPSRRRPTHTRYDRALALAGEHASRPAAGASTSTVPSDREEPEVVCDLGVLRRRRRRPARAPGSSQRASGADRAEHGDEGQAAEQRAAPLVAVDIDGNATHDHELRQEQHRLGEDQAAGVEAGVVLVEHVAGDDDVDVGEREEREQRLGVVERLAR